MREEYRVSLAKGNHGLKAERGAHDDAVGAAAGDVAIGNEEHEE